MPAYTCVCTQFSLLLGYSSFSLTHILFFCFFLLLLLWFVFCFLTSSKSVHWNSQTVVFFFRQCTLINAPTRTTTKQLGFFSWQLNMTKEHIFLCSHTILYTNITRKIPKKIFARRALFSLFLENLVFNGVFTFRNVWIGSFMRVLSNSWLSIQE